MEDEVKVVVFHVDVPKSGEIFEDDFISSEEFTIQYNGKTSIWKLKCNLNGNYKEFSTLKSVNTLHYIHQIEVKMI
jgi:hypothetical protein